MDPKYTLSPHILNDVLCLTSILDENYGRKLHFKYAWIKSQTKANFTVSILSNNILHILWQNYSLTWNSTQTYWSPKKIFT